MGRSKIGILHPGEMGVSVAASAKSGGQEVFWVSEGRSPETRSRAAQFELIDLTTMEAFCTTVEVIISVCPPHAAKDVLDSVIASGFSGIYLDANAISPQKTILLGEQCASNGISYCDGGIVGGPAWEPNKTILYLSGVEAEKLARIFAHGPLETHILGDRIGPASALKMCFAAYTKGSTALTTMILAAAETFGVREELMTLWSKDGSGFAEESERRAVRVTQKAWRFAGEMDEIAATFGGVGLPGGFHQASGEIYQRLRHLRNSTQTPELEQVLHILLGNERSGN